MAWEDERIALVQVLDAQRVTIFSASCCQRMLRSYAKFQRDEQWGRYQELESALDRIWHHVSGESLLLEVELRSLAEQTEDAAPDTAEHRSVFTSAALDAATAIGETLMLMLDRDVRRGLTVAALATDSVDMFVQVVDELPPMGLEMEEHIRTHPLMVREVGKQKEDLALLGIVVAIDAAIVAEFRHGSSYDLLA